MTKRQISIRSQTTIKRTLVVSVIFIALSHLAFQLIRTHFELSDFWIDLSNRFNVDEEASFPTWFSASLLLTLSAGAFWVSTVRSAAAKRAWQGIGAVFLLMSIDEGSSFHETIIWPLRRALEIENGSLFTNAWILIGVFIVIALGIALFKNLKHLKPHSQKLFITGFMFFIGGILGIEAVGGLFVDNETLYRTWIVLTEELLELSGLTFFAFGLLHELDKS